MAFILNKDETESFKTDFHFPTSQKALIIFTRNPELGKCKTRLAATIGDENALAIYKMLLQHTVDISKDLNLDKYIYYSETISKDDIWDPSIFRKKTQEGIDLGSRMENAFAELFSLGYEKVLIIGSDIYDLKQSDIERAFKALEEHNFVVGPAQDGGYYLLGMNKMNTNVFRNKNWGTATVLNDTLKDLLNETVKKLDTLNDIDVYEDIINLDIFRPYLAKK